MARRRLTSELRRQELLDTADALLPVHGTALRVEDITRAAGAAKGTFYTCFETWDDLLIAVRARRIEVLGQRIAPLLTPGVSTDWPTRLPRLAETLTDFILDLGKLHEVLFHSAFPLTHPLPAEREPAARFAALLRAGQAAGAYVALDPDPTGGLIFAMIHETADAIAAGMDRDRALRALSTALTRLVSPTEGGFHADPAPETVLHHPDRDGPERRSAAGPNLMG